ncbi:MAG TPA: hypothetical protein VMF06_04040 [Candidatus Limnocylindria bacterium]|nr:hypothetical protein [Candidatus Limnocylindria bacterium]
MNRFVLAASLALASSAQAAVVVTYSGSLDILIPDDTSTGLASTLNVAATGTITELTVSLDLSVPAGQTGWFGDLYAYVQHGSDIAVLLARSGATTSNPFGYDDSQTVSLTFADDATNGDIHNYRTALGGGADTSLAGPLTGIWAPDGRTTDPSLTVSSDRRTALLNVFNGSNAQGTWTLFVADMSGGYQYKIDGWGLNITAIPEPVGARWAIGLLLGIWVLGGREARER